MLSHLHEIRARWNSKPGAFGDYLRQYLEQHPTTIHEYSLFVEKFIDAYPETAFSDWYYPSLVERLANWEYDEHLLYEYIVQSKHPRLWEQLFPYAFTHLERLDLASSVRWETFVKKWPDYLQSDFYKHIDPLVAQVFVKVEMSSKPHVVNPLRYITCLKVAKYSSKDREQGHPWNQIYEQLMSNHWESTSEQICFKQLALEWIRHSDISDRLIYIEKANQLLMHPLIHWSFEELQNVICRYRNEEDSGSELLESWLLLENQPPWKFIFEYQQGWDETLLLKILTRQKIQDDNDHLHRLILEQPYSLRLKRDILIHQCETTGLSDVDIVQSRNWPLPLQQIIIFWIIYRDAPIAKPLVSPIMEVYKYHPTFEKEKLALTYLPGFSRIKSIVESMDVSWSHALHYMESSIKIYTEMTKDDLLYPLIDSHVFEES